MFHKYNKIIKHTNNVCMTSHFHELPIDLPQTFHAIFVHMSYRFFCADNISTGLREMNLYGRFILHSYYVTCKILVCLSCHSVGDIVEYYIKYIFYLYFL